MLELYKAEFSRYKIWMLLATVAILAAFGFIAKIKPFLEPEAMQSTMTTFALVGGSFFFGIVQFVLHKRANHWTYLIHRPISENRIYLSLAAAGASIIAIPVLLPLLIMIGGIDATSNVVVDTRHYLYALYMLIVSLAAYGIGSFTVLNASKAAVLSIIILSVYLMPIPESSFKQFFPGLVILAAIVVMNFVSFKADLTTHTKEPWAIVLQGMGMSVSLLILLLASTTIFYHLPLVIAGIHPDDNPEEGSFNYIYQYDMGQRPAYALRGSKHLKASIYAKQAELADQDFLSVDRWTFPRQGQMFNKDRQYALSPSDLNQIWQFSHDDMLMLGYDTKSKQLIGLIGQNGFLDSFEDVKEEDRFTTVPFMIGETFLGTQHRLYQVSFKDRELLVKHQPAEGEVYIGQLQFKDNYAVMVTDKNTLLFDTAALVDEFEEAEAEYVIPHPTAPENMYWVSTYRMADGYMLLFSGGDYFGESRPGTTVVHAQLGGTSEVIHETEYEYVKHPLWIQHFEFMISPVTFFMKSMVFHYIEPSDTDNLSFSKIANGMFPNSIWTLAVVLQIIAAIGAFIWARRHNLAKPQMITWVAMCAVFGLPLLLGFFFMSPWKKEAVVS